MHFRSAVGWFFILIGALHSTLTAFAQPTPELPITIEVPGSSRKAAQVYVPKGHPERHPWPLVMLLHGKGATGKQENLYFSLSSRVTPKGFLLVIPEGTKNKKGQQFWNATEACCDDDHSNVDDEGYLLELIREVKKTYPVDQKRVYILGHSNGGSMAYRMACRASSTFSAVVSLAGATFNDPTQCQPEDAVSVLEIHAQDDSDVLYDGGLKNGIQYPGAIQTVGNWLRNEGCEESSYQDAGPFDLIWSIPGQDTTTRTWTKCRDDSEVGLWTIQPYALHYAHAPMIGPELITRVLNFFFSHSKQN